MPLPTPTQSNDVKKSDESQLSTLSIALATPAYLILGLMAVNQIASNYSTNAKLYREDNMTLGLAFLWTIPLLIIGAVIATRIRNKRRLCLLVNLIPIALPAAISIVA